MQVKMAAPGWTDIDATNAMAGVMLKALGYRQDVANLSVPITYQGLKKGQIDVFLGNWMPAQAPLVKAFVAEKSIDVVHPNLTNAKFTLAVPPISLPRAYTRSPIFRDMPPSSVARCTASSRVHWPTRTSRR
jgi:ABC-type proline/glycine betaine transport system substrate-binding protein